MSELIENNEVHRTLKYNSKKIETLRHHLHSSHGNKITYNEFTHLLHHGYTTIFPILKTKTKKQMQTNMTMVHLVINNNLKNHLCTRCK